jgi:steroid delta-isomerase-like uncharacterized protein
MPDPSEDQTLRAIIESYDDAWNRQDLEAIIARHTLDSVFESHATGEVAAGQDAIRRMIKLYFRIFPDLTFHIRRLYARPGLVVQEWTARATHARTLRTRDGAFAPTGCPLTWDGVDVMPMEGALIVRKDAYMDRAGLLRQLAEQKILHSLAK